MLTVVSSLGSCNSTVHKIRFAPLQIASRYGILLYLLLSQKVVINKIDQIAKVTFVYIFCTTCKMRGIFLQSLWLEIVQEKGRETLK